MSKENDFELPIGYFTFHTKQLYNFQFNRWYSLGFASYDDMMEAGTHIKTFSDWKQVLLDLAEKAEKEGRIKNAAIYYRGAEFYITQKDPDKLRCYKRFIELFDQLFKDDIKRFKIPYEDAFLPALKISSTTRSTKGTIVIHGGFDSFIEEFYFIMRMFADKGFDVIGFEGPGQGGARRLYDLAWTEKWERPTKTVIDFFDLDEVTLFGISMGGHLCLRAAAFDKRIKRVISSGGAVDYWKIPNTLARYLMRLFIRFEDFSTRTMQKKMEKDEHHNWFAENAMYITKIDNPFLASIRMLDLDEENAQPLNITQDVLILTGRNDHFIPFKMHRKTMKAFHNAASVKGIVYTNETHAQNHCQIGNIPLVCTDIIDWIKDHS